MAEILRTEQLSMEFGGLRAVADLDLTINEGEIIGLIGPNGAGKTTVFNVIGVYRPTTGRVIFAGQDITIGDQTDYSPGYSPYLPKHSPF